MKAIIGGIVCAYAMVAFLNWGFNPGEWRDEDRGVFILLASLSWLILFCFQKGGWLRNDREDSK